MAAGAHLKIAFFAARFSQDIRSHNLPIAQLEALAQVHAVPDHPCNYLISISTDNLAFQQVLASGKGKDPLLCACAHQLWRISATKSCEILHKPSVKPVLADALSHSLTEPAMKRKAATLCSSTNHVKILVTLSLSVLGFEL